MYEGARQGEGFGGKSEVPRLISGILWHPTCEHVGLPYLDCDSPSGTFESTSLFSFV